MLTNEVVEMEIKNSARTTERSDEPVKIVISRPREGTLPKKHFEIIGEASNIDIPREESSFTNSYESS